jgi:hypothetical protein
MGLEETFNHLRRAGNQAADTAEAEAKDGTEAEREVVKGLVWKGTEEVEMAYDWKS